MRQLIRTIGIALWCMAGAAVFSSCGDDSNDEPTEGSSYEVLPGAVKMEIDGAMQEIDKVAFDFPKDADHIDLTVYSYRGKLTETSIKVKNSHAMSVEVIPPSAEEHDPSQTFDDLNSYREQKRHTLRVTALDEDDVHYIVFEVLTFEPFTIFKSEFTVGKPINP